MRMKFNKSSQLLLVGAASLLAASLVTACSQLTQTLTVDFVYVASAKAAGADNYGEINVFEINSESGRMRQIPTSPFPSQGRNPVAEAVSVDYGSLFVVNEDDNTIAQFGIGTDGKLYPYNTVNTPGIFPLAIAANKSNLFVVDLYQPLPLCSNADPCSGSIGVFPLTSASGSTPVAIGSPLTNPAVSGQYWPLTLSGASASHVIVPTAVNVLASGADVYVTAYDSSVVPNVGYVFGFSVGSGGTLTPLSGSPFAAGVKPSAIASDATSAHVYVTDFSSGNVRGYTVSLRQLDAPRRQPLPRRQSALRHRRRSFLPVCLCGQLPRQQCHRLLHQQWRALEHWHVRHRPAARGHRNRPLDGTFPLHSQLPRQHGLGL